MKKVGTISALKKDLSDAKQKTMQNQLMKQGYTRMPGTGVYKFPFKESSGKYRTGLDPNASYIERIQDPTAQQLEKDRVKKLRDKLEKALGVDLSPNNANFWNYTKGVNGNVAVSSIKLLDGDNIFDLSDPWKELTYAWLRVHPTIASSMQAYLRGEYPADTQFYVNDEDVETEIAFKKKKAVNEAITILNSLSPSKRTKVGRLMGLPVSEDSKEELVYNLIDNELKKTEIKSGKYQGLSPVQIFINFATMDNKLLEIRSLIKEAITHSVYRVKSTGRIYEGDLEIAKDEDELIKYLADESHQEDYLSLSDKVKGKKLASV
jgi:hypothetical protein